ncbi:hypothetical protein AVEN_22263-1, partial [Araneus ventricosus]
LYPQSTTHVDLLSSIVYGAVKRPTVNTTITIKDIKFIELVNMTHIEVVVLRLLRSSSSEITEAFHFNTPTAASEAFDKRSQLRAPPDKLSDHISTSFGVASNYDATFLRKPPSQFPCLGSRIIRAPQIRLELIMDFQRPEPVECL